MQTIDQIDPEQFLFVEKYRPKTIDQAILPQSIKTTLQQFVDRQQIPNLILCGSPGCGKTTAARALVEQIGSQYMIINGSLDGNIDTLRTQIKEFASSMSLNNKRKFVILDEADYLTHSTQPALRNFMEEFSNNCGFILTCNYKNKIIDPLHSRCSLIEFKISKQDKPEMAKQLFARLKYILNAESIKYDTNVIVELIKKYFPDFRKLINEIQKYSVGGMIDSGILVDFETVEITKLAQLMKEKNLTAIRQWVIDAQYDDAYLYRKLYDTTNQLVEPHSIPVMILIISKYMYQSAFAIDHEINTVACLVEMMTELEFK